MNKSSNSTRTTMTDGMFMNSNSSNESNSDDEKCRLLTVDLIFPDKNEEKIVVKQQTTKTLPSRNSLINNKDVINFNESIRTNNGIEHDIRSCWRSNSYTDAHLSEDNNENSRLGKTG